VEGFGGLVEGLLGVGEEVGGVGVGVDAEDEVGGADGVVGAVFEGVAEGLEEVEGGLFAGGVTGVADDGVDGFVGAGGVDDGVVAYLDVVASFDGAAADEVVDLCRVDVAVGVTFVGVRCVFEGCGGDVVAGAGVLGALDDGLMVMVEEVAYDGQVFALEVVGRSKWGWVGGDWAGIVRTTPRLRVESRVLGVEGDNLRSPGEGLSFGGVGSSGRNGGVWRRPR
jgi:hypothetical protein